MEQRSFWCCLEEVEARLYSGWAGSSNLSGLIVYYKLLHLPFRPLAPVHRVILL